MCAWSYWSWQPSTVHQIPFVWNSYFSRRNWSKLLQQALLLDGSRDLIILCSGWQRRLLLKGPHHPCPVGISTSGMANGHGIAKSSNEVWSCLSLGKCYIILQNFNFWHGNVCKFRSLKSPKSQNEPRFLSVWEIAFCSAVYQIQTCGFGGFNEAKSNQ